MGCEKMRTVFTKWCIENSRMDLMEQWDNDKNLLVNPEQCTYGSAKKVWWKCDNGHSWEATIGSRTSGSGCPFCSGRFVIPGENDLATLYPEISSEWHIEKNGNLMPQNVKAGNHLKVWWLCNRCGHEWKAAISSRASNGCGCPECAKRNIAASRIVPKIGYSLSEKYPEIASEWNYDKNEQLNPNEIAARSSRIVWWKCKNGHEWQSAVRNRTGGRGCPYCGHKKIESGFNDLETINPELAKEWHPTRNAMISAKDVSPSSSRKVWWKCQNGHEWMATVNNRTKRGCPVCSKARRVSFPEKAIYFYISKMWEDAVENYRPSWLKGKEIDIYIPSLKIGIEYDGEQYHVNVNSDLEKDLICRGEQVKLLHVREPECPYLESDSLVFQLQSRSELELETTISHILLYLRDCTGRAYEIPQINITENRTEIYKLIGFNGVDDSIFETHPNLVKEWNFEKNGTLTPAMVTKGSDRKIWWICEKGHTWEATVSHRVSGRGCPFCAGKRILKGFNDFQTLYPGLMTEWDFDRNRGIDPGKYGKSSSKKVWWCCEACGYSWQASLIGRAEGSGCPFCLSKYLAKKNSVPKKGKSLAEVNPTLAKQWHPFLNENLTPEEVAAGSHKNVWWLCEKGHEWQALVNSRNHGNGCPYCSHRKSLV